MKNCPVSPPNVSKEIFFQKAEQLKELYYLADIFFTEVETVYKQEIKTLLWFWFICMLLLLPISYWSSYFCINSGLIITIILSVLALSLESKKEKSIKRLNELFTPKFNNLLIYFDTPDERISIKYRNLDWNGRYLILNQIQNIFNQYFEITTKELENKFCGGVRVINTNELLIIGERQYKRPMVVNSYDKIMEILHGLSLRFGVEMTIEQSDTTIPRINDMAIVICRQLNITLLNSTMIIKII